MVKIGIGVAVVGAMMIGLLIFAMLQQAKVSCEVCISFRGNVDCRTAVGPTRKDAVGTATDNACGLLAGGMADTIECSKTTPLSEVCDGD